MKIIGINSGIDGRFEKIDAGGSALIIDGKIIMALAEERITRVKHDCGYSKSLEFILKSTNLKMEDIDCFYISFYGTPYNPSKDVMNFHINKLGLHQRPESLITISSHHFSHAVSSFFLSPFEKAIIMVSDSEGSELLFDASNIAATQWCERNSYYFASHNKIHLIGRDFESPGEIGFGKAYTRFTRYIGFENYHAAGKTMGLAAYGQLSKEMLDIDIWNMDYDGKLRSNLTSTSISGEGIKLFFENKGIKIPEMGTKNTYNDKEYQNLAAFVQYQLNKFSMRKIEYLVKMTGVKIVCIGGGVALNTTMNSFLENELGIKIFVPPYPCDEGQALGNAIYGYIQETKFGNNSTLPIKRFTDFIYLGSEYSDQQIESIFSDESISYWNINSDYDICKKTSELIAKGYIVGWFQGKSEYGARALGNRSILADPRVAEFKSSLNIIKGRELFRPFAPSVLKEYADSYFEIKDSELYKYMLGVAKVKNDKIDVIPAVVHVDHTSRIHIVDRQSNELFYRLIFEFYSRTGVPLVLNTSFNFAGEPIVESPLDALKSATKMNLDILVIGKYLLTRK
ncbi:carbamoyltransferase C-terminal domain-containing protein [Flavobacterium sp. UBA6031]|uniref:carbamoyltransferase C-terminal domain-containing protein n=1 Tax=Flavobacterium sp. UBA6031 TaxID=1946551 RepID=UPI0025C2BDB5|nr:carbamoyltransferase C-terminal domain-containing protein [Flavobacterium sp. UBA6031]